jgi:hypothetical protein
VTTIDHQYVRRVIRLTAAMLVLCATLSGAVPAPPLAAVVTDQTPLVLPSTFGLPPTAALGSGGHYAFISGMQYAAFRVPAGSSTVTRMIQHGDAIPGEPGSVVTFLSSLRTNPSGVVALLASYASGDTTNRALMTFDGASLAKVAFASDPAPGAGTAFGVGMILIGINASAAVAFSAPLMPIGSNSVTLTTTLYIGAAGATPVRVAGVGDVAPETGGGTFSAMSGLGFNDAGAILFRATISGGTGGYGLFVGTTTGTRKVVATGDLDPTGGTFAFSASSFSSASTARMNNSGQVAFVDSSRLFISTPSLPLIAAVTTATNAPVPLASRTVSSLSSISDFNDSGAVVFVATLSGPPAAISAILRYGGIGQLAPVAYGGQLVPGSATQTFSQFASVTMNAAGDVAFSGTITPNTPNAGGIFKLPSGGTLTTLVLDGTASTGGGTYRTSRNSALTADGSVYFEAYLNDTDATYGAFLVTSQTTRSLVRDSDQLPAGAKVVITDVFQRDAGHNVGFVALRAGGRHALFVHDQVTGATTRIAADGDVFDAGGTARSVSSSLWYVGTSGTTVFTASRTGTSVTFLYAVRPRTSGLLTVAATGDAAPGTGSTFTVLSVAFSIASVINASDQVLFRGSYAGGNGLFVGRPGQTPALAVKTGDAVPGGGTFSTGSFTSALLNDAGQVVFSGAITGGAGSGIYAVTPGSAPVKVAAVGDAAPGGGTFASFGAQSPVGFNAVGQVLFFATLDGGASVGLYLATLGGGIEAVASNAVFSPSGSGYAFTSSSKDARLAANGDVLFQAPLAASFFSLADSGLFLRRAATGAVVQVAAQGYPAPGTTATFGSIMTTINNLPGEYTALGPGGEVWFENLVNVSGRFVTGVFRFGLDGVLEKVALRGQPTPDGGGGTVRSMAQGPGAGFAGRFVVHLSQSGGSWTDAIITTTIANPKDLTGDGRSDLGAFRPSNGTWYVRGASPIAFGFVGDIPVPADYNGDGVNELATYTPSTSEWAIRGVTTVMFGGQGDIPVPGDYDGDHVADLAVYRPSSGQWVVRNMATVWIGQPGDIPVPGDYDGDGRTDIAIFRPSTGMWIIDGKTPVAFGANGDVPLAFDSPTLGKTLFAYYRPSTGVWAIRDVGTFTFGLPGDLPFFADANGDGVTDLVAYRPGTSTWMVYDTVGIPPVTSIPFGVAGDRPLWIASSFWFRGSPIIATVFHESNHRPYPGGAAPEGVDVHTAIAVSGGTYVPAGTVGIRYYTGTTCTGTPLSDTTVALDVTGAAHPSGTAMLTASGLSVLVSYSGDGTNTATASCTPLAAASDIVFTDMALFPRTTVVRAVHVTDLRLVIDSLRASNGLTAFSWTDPVLGPGITRVRAAHLTDLRTALEQVYEWVARPKPSWFETTIPTRAITIKASHLAEIRLRLNQDW